MSTDISAEYIRMFKLRFKEMKDTAEEAFRELDEEQLFWAPDEESYSIADIVKHMNENMMSRWADFLYMIGQKRYQYKDGESNPALFTRREFMKMWEKGWNVLLNSLAAIREDSLMDEIKIRNKPYRLIEALERQTYYYSFYIGQIVYISKLLKSGAWIAEAVPKRAE